VPGVDPLWESAVNGWVSGTCQAQLAG